MTTTDRVPAAGPAADGEARAAPRAGGPGSETRRVPGDLEAGTAGGGSRRGRPPRLRVVVVAAVLAGAFAFLLAKGLGSSLDFYLPADQAVAQRAQLGDRTFNLEGVVRPGSIRATTRGVDFVLTAGPTAVAVHDTGSPPQLFQANVPVIAVGHFSGTGFVSGQILVKHSATYVAAHPGRVTAPDGSKR
ncbi:MAG TPA: cytochrome c maturation protein CcmE [Acidimicrobiales bacterium]|nr:cytochrome c maturation protein CcmE [Acidimicrobiales bacterium]